MQIFSGIAIPGWWSDGSMDYLEVYVHFDVPAPGHYPDDWEFTLTTSLASIDADGDNDFSFATDECKMARADELDGLPAGATDELVLYAKIAALGTPGYLNRFSYHAELLSTIPVQGTVAGTIRWSVKYGDPTNAVLGGAPMFRVGPATYDPGSGIGGGGGAAPGFSWDPQYTVETTAPPQQIETTAPPPLQRQREWAVPYVITGLPLDKPLEIRPDLLPGTLDGPRPPFTGGPGFAPPFQPITLTSSAPSAAPVDFEMVFGSGPGG